MLKKNKHVFEWEENVASRNQAKHQIQEDARGEARMSKFNPAGGNIESFNMRSQMLARSKVADSNQSVALHNHLNKADVTGSQNSNLSGNSGFVMPSDQMSQGSCEDRDREKLDGGHAQGLRFNSDPSKIKRSQFSRNAKVRSNGSGGGHVSFDGAIIHSKGKEIS